MKKLGPWLVLSATMLLASANENMMPATERNGRRYVSENALNKVAEVAIKSLPGRDKIVACVKDRCAGVTDFFRNGDEIFVSVAALSEALGATPRFDENQQHVSFEFVSRTQSASAAIARVGGLAPNFRLSTLDGNSVALSDFRGKRVLINSWASW